MGGGRWGRRVSCSSVRLNESQQEENSLFPNLCNLYSSSREGGEAQKLVMVL